MPLRILPTRLTVAAAVAAALAAAGPIATTAARDDPPACPAQEKAPSDHRSDAHRVLLSPGANSLRACRYAGLNGPGRPLHLERQALVTGAGEIARLTRLFDHLPAVHGVFACPADDASEIVVLASFPRGGSSSVAVHLTGCQMASNGVIARGAGGPGAAGPELMARLDALVPGTR